MTDYRTLWFKSAFSRAKSLDLTLYHCTTPYNDDAGYIISDDGLIADILDAREVEDILNRIERDDEQDVYDVIKSAIKDSHDAWVKALRERAEQTGEMQVVRQPYVNDDGKIITAGTGTNDPRDTWDRALREHAETITAGNGNEPF